MLETEPVKTFRGTWDEVVSHRDEIPEGAIVEVRVYVPKPVAEEGIGDFGGRSVGDMIREIGFIEADGSSNMARHPEKYMKGFGETKSRRKLSR